jgi:hypothetical protein
MIILNLEILFYIFAWDAVGQEIMYSLYVEGLLDLGVRSDVKVKKDEKGEYKESEAPSHHFESMLDEVGFCEHVYILLGLCLNHCRFKLAKSVLAPRRPVEFFGSMLDPLTNQPRISIK